MTLAMGNKNVVVGLLVIMLYLSMSFFIEGTSALHQFHEKAAAVVVDTKGTADLLLFPLRDTIGFWGRYLDPK